MKVSICLVASLLLVCVGVNMANDEMMEDEKLIHNLVKRSKPASSCVNAGKSCRYRKCCSSSTCVYGSCQACNQRKCKKTRDCCDESSCVYGICKSCNPRTCKQTRDCCRDSKCVYRKCKSCRGMTCQRKKDCCEGYTCSYKKCVRKD